MWLFTRLRKRQGREPIDQTGPATCYDRGILRLAAHAAPSWNDQTIILMDSPLVTPAQYHRAGTWPDRDAQ